MPEVLQLLLYDYVENALEARAPHREGHLALVREWSDAGRLPMAGALGDPPTGGALAFRVGGPDDVRAFVDADPYVEHGVVTSWRVVPWTVVTASA